MEQLHLNQKTKADRVHFRIGCHIDIEISLASAPEVRAQALCNNLSGGGLRFIADERFNVGDEIDITLHFVTGDVTTRARIVRTGQAPQGARHAVEIAAAFEQNVTTERQICGYVLQLQRLLIQKQRASAIGVYEVVKSNVVTNATPVFA